MRSKAAFRGHSLHPILITVPLGALPLSLLFQGLHLLTARATWYEAAVVSVVAGAVGIVVATVPALVDFVSVVPREGAVWKRATSHMALGFVLNGFYIALAVMMGLALPQPQGLVAWALAGINLVGLGLLALQGYWGGELVSRHGIGVHRRALEEDRARGGPAGRPDRGH